MTKLIGEEQEPVTNDTAVPEVVATPTAEQQLETLQAQIKAETEAREKAERSIQGLRGSLEEKDRELKKRAAIDARLDGFEETQRILAAMVNERISSGEIGDEEKSDYLKQFDEITKRQKAEREQSQLRSQQEEYGVKARTLHARAVKAYGDNDAAILRVERLLDTGSITEAEEKVTQAEVKLAPKGEEIVETEEEKKVKWIKEGERLAMERTGQLVSETGGPSGAAKGKFSRESLREYSAIGKSVSEMKKDADAIIAQITKK